MSNKNREDREDILSMFGVDFDEEELPLELRPIVERKTMWTLESALLLIRLIYPVALRAGYNLHLGGSVMYSGQSVNDLDIIAIRRPNVLSSNIKTTLQELEKVGFYNNYTIKDVPYRMIYRIKCQKSRFPIWQDCKLDLIVLDLLGDLPEQTVEYAFSGSGHEDNETVAEIRAHERQKFEDLLLKVDMAGELAIKKLKEMHKDAAR